jgi:branched-chain amino acid transport system substrate-binding protein
MAPIRTAASLIVLVAAGLAAGCGGGHALRAVGADSCGPVLFHGKGKPRYLIVSDLPLRAPPGAREQVAGIKRALELRGFRAGRYSVGYQSCDDSSATAGARDTAVCTANAKAYAADTSVLGVIGPYNSECAALEIPILNRAQKGPLAIVGTATTNPQLTARVPGGDPGTPGSYYPTGIRNFVRLAAPDQFQAAAAAMFAQKHHLARMYVLDDGEAYGTEMAGWFRQAAGPRNVHVVATAAWDPRAKDYSALVARVVRARPDGVFLSGFAFLHGTTVLKELRAKLPAKTVVLAPDGFSDPGEDVAEAGKAADGLYYLWAMVPPSAAGPRGRQILQRTGRERDGDQQYGALYGAAATELLLDAMAASDGSRRSVVTRLFRSSTRRSILGRFGFDRNGDPTIGAVTVYQIRGKKTTTSEVLYPHSPAAAG